MNRHEMYEELVVGRALDALEPADEATLAAHLGGCPPCQRQLQEMRELAGHLAYAVEPEEPPAALLEGLRAAMAASPRQVSQPDLPVVDTLERHRAARRVQGAVRHAGRLAVAAGVMGVLALGSVAVHLQQNESRSQRALSAYAQALRGLDNPGAHLVPLGVAGAAGGAVVITGSRVAFVAHDLGRNDTQNSTYVLWAAKPTGVLVGIARFDVTDDGVTVVDAVLPDGFDAVPQRFAVSHERGRTIPDVPGQSVLGASTS